MPTNATAGTWARASAVWVLLMLAETAHGTLRQLYMAPLIGDFRARQASVFSGSILVFLVALACIRWIGAIRKPTLLAIGVSWLAFTLLFEIALGRLLGFGWQRILADYDLRHGGLMLIGLGVLLVTPLAAARLRDRLEARRAR